MPIILESGGQILPITALGLIKVAAKKLGVLGQGEELSASDANDGLAALNSMVDGLAVEKLLLHHMVLESFIWPANTVSRTIGSGGNFDTEWPQRIEAGTFFRDSGGNDYAVDVTQDQAVYRSLTFKSISGAIPQILFYDRAFPLGTIYLYPYPAPAMTLFLTSWKTLQVFTSLGTQLSLPPGYRRMLENTLAVEMESTFGLPCPQSVKDISREAKAALKRVNSSPMLTDLAEATTLFSGRLSSGRASILGGGD